MCTTARMCAVFFICMPLLFVCHRRWLLVDKAGKMWYDKHIYEDCIWRRYDVVWKEKSRYL